MQHPYKTQPRRAFWSRAVSQRWEAASLAPAAPLLRPGDRVATLGSCFAANLIPYLRQAGFDYVQEEQRHAAFSDLPEDNFSYSRFSAAYGNIYTTRQFRQLLERALGRFSPQENCWRIGNEFVDPFRPGLRYRARTRREFDLLSENHLAAVARVFRKADVVIFTLGLTEAWVSKVDGAVFPACPGTVAGEFDADRHGFHNFTVAEIVEDLEAILGLMGKFREDTRLILTVSPVPLVATATQDHVLEASIYSKSVLRAACGEICAAHENVAYFPSYEIITGPQARGAFFEPDLRSVSAAGVEEVMRVFLAHRAPATPMRSAAAPAVDVGAISRRAMKIDCEEAATDA